MNDPIALDAGSIEWARRNMPIIANLRAELANSKPFVGLAIGVCLHIEAKTAVWIDALVAGGATIALTGSPGSTDPSVAAELDAHQSVSVFADVDDTFESHLGHCREVLRQHPQMIVDNGADLHRLLCTESEFDNVKQNLLGATEETMSGSKRLREEWFDGVFPTLVIDDTQTKRIVENRHGVGSSTVDGLMRATNRKLPGTKVAVVGYGYCGSGIARYLKGLGCIVSVIDTNSLRALEAHLDGFSVRSLELALAEGPAIVVTATGADKVVGRAVFEQLADGILLANAGHFATEIDIEALAEEASEVVSVSGDIDCYVMQDGRRINVVSSGNLVNLSAASGNPIEIMDLGLALQTESLRNIATDRSSLAPGPQPVPEHLEKQVAERALAVWAH